MNSLITAYYKWRNHLVQSYNLLLNKFIVIPPHILSHLPHSKHVLVIAPHPDDEVIGCGGTIRKLIQQGTAVEVVIITTEKNLTEGNTITAVRTKEADAAAKILGVTQLSFWDFDDGGLRPTGKLKERLLAKIEETRPSIIFAPNIFDNHPDHIIIGRQLIEALKSYSVDFQCYFFEVWTPLIANTLVDISKEIEVKVQAMKAHESQEANTEFVDMFLSINRYRAIASLSGNPAMKYAEAFFCVNKNELWKLARHL